MEGIAAVVLAAGQGKRIGHPDIPKVLLPVQGRPLISYVLQAVCLLPPERLVVVVGFRGEQVATYIRERYPQAEVVWQHEQLGTGHAVLQTAPLLQSFPGDILIVAGDTPLLQVETLREFVQHHRSAGAAVSVLSARFPNPQGYGRIVRGESGELLRIVEDRDATAAERRISEVNTGVIVARASVLFSLLPLLSRQNAQREYYLTDIVALCRQRGHSVAAWSAPRWEEFQGVNTLQELELVEHLLQQWPTQVSFR